MDDKEFYRNECVVEEKKYISNIFDELCRF